MKKRTYAGAQSSRLNFNWIASGTSADSEILSSRAKLTQRTRQLCRDNVYVRQAQRSICLNVVGNGTRMQAQVRKQRGGKLDKKINDHIEMEWKKWGRYDSCSANGRECLADIERIIVKQLFEAGEVFVRVIRKPFGRSTVPLSLELLEPEQLDGDYAGKTKSKNNEWRLGIERDSFNRAVRYAFFRNHPGDTSFPSAPGQMHMFIPANEIMHLYISDRPSQSRGVSWLASSLQDMHHLAGFQESQVVRARASSALMGFITTNDPDGLTGDDVYDNERVSEFQPGAWKYLGPNESVQVPDLDAPNGEFEPFMRAMLRSLASGCGISYESVSKDFSMTNYSSSRLSLLEDRDHYRMIQSYIEERFLQPLFDQWLELAVLSGNLDLPGYEIEPERYRRVRWLFRGWSWVDPQKEISAAVMAVKAGFKTQAEVISESGGDIEELMPARKNEIEQAEQLGLNFDTMLTQADQANMTEIVNTEANEKQA
jgi:lambda family phage portal protein